MPALDLDNPGAVTVEDFETTLCELLDEASAIVKQTSAIGQPLTKADLKNFSERIATSLPDQGAIPPEASEEETTAIKRRHDGIIENAARLFFGKLIVSVSIDSPDFSSMWHLLDIMWILSDDGICDTTLPLTMVEDLLESQTIPGCRIVLDYLESRRERIVGKGLAQKQTMPLLRSCNELLRRLSRAEDTAFCGRVFIFLFQCLPMGDRSSTNMKGEFHVDNVTTFEDRPQVESDSRMDLDPKKDSREGNKSQQEAGKDKALSPEELYPMFWSLQESFSQPEKLFDPAHFSKFKQNMEAVIEKFRELQPDESNRNLRSTSSLEDAKAGLKRKRIKDEHDEPLEVFHPKYLTSKDLFDLEIGDVVFRRHILIQALIIIHFLLSLSPKGKEKIASINGGNKAVHYTYELNEEDTKWTTDMRLAVERQLRPDNNSYKFYRVVDTVLARDKNWVYWKLKSCPRIERKPIEPESFKDAKAAAQRAATNKRLRPTPLGAVPLDFLREQDGDEAMEKLKATERWQFPELDGFKEKIASDDFEISMPSNDQTKAAAVAGKASKSWRALRIAGRSKMVAFDKIDDPQTIDAIFKEVTEDADDDDLQIPEGEEGQAPANHGPIIVSGPPGVGKSALINRLLEENKGVFTKVVRHTTREAQEGEVDGKDYHFVKAQEFNQLRDGDRLIEYGTRNGHDYGTSSKVLDAITDNDKIPIIELDLEASQFAKDMDFSARYILIKPLSTEALSSRLKDGGRDEAAVKAILAKLPEQLDESKTGEVFDTAIVNGELETSVKAFRNFVYSEEKGGEQDGANGDVPMGEESD